jgi:hypothetical protein
MLRASGIRGPVPKSGDRRRFRRAPSSGFRGGVARRSAIAAVAGLIVLNLLLAFRLVDDGSSTVRQGTAQLDAPRPSGQESGRVALQGLNEIEIGTPPLAQPERLHPHKKPPATPTSEVGGRTRDTGGSLSGGSTATTPTSTASSGSGSSDGIAGGDGSAGGDAGGGSAGGSSSGDGPNGGGPGGGGGSGGGDDSSGGGDPSGGPGGGGGGTSGA